MKSASHTIARELTKTVKGETLILLHTGHLHDDDDDDDKEDMLNRTLQTSFSTISLAGFFALFRAMSASTTSCTATWPFFRQDCITSLMIFLSVTPLFSAILL